MQLTDTGNLKSKWLPGSLILLGVIVIALALIADQFGLGGIQGFGPNQISMLFSGIALLIAGLIVNSTEAYHNLWFWVLLLVGVVIVAQAADLLILGGLPGFLVKQLAVGVLILGVALPGSISGTRAEGGNLLAWFRSVLVEKIQIGKFLAISVQLVLLLLLIRQFELENQAFYNNLMLLVLYGFFIHYFLPGQYRLPFFFFLSLAAIAGIFGLGNGIWLVGIGLVLIAISHLPISFNLRVVLLILVGAGLVVLRMEVFQSPIPGIIWPVLGSMFMFRMIIYMYDLRHEKDHNLWRTLSYFFLLPNVVFPFFPIVDYAAFRRTYFNKEQFRIYQTGVEWIFRGVVHLIFYRFVNYYLVLAPEQVHTAPQLAIFVISNFLLYVRVSGQFHIIVGLLHLFGFNLPETFHKYFLSTSFTEMWRRFNIYWKDFMQKIIYNPTYMRLRKLGTTAAILLATLWIFILMWLLHTYQWFWLRGTVVVTPQDGLFRLSLAALMIGNTYIELKRGRKRSLGGESWNLREMAGSALRAAGVFTTMCILWSLWTGGSIADWLNLWSIAGELLQNILILLAIFAGIVGVLFLALLFEKATDRILKFSPNDNAIFKPAVLNGSLIALVLFISTPTVLNRIGGSAQAFIEDLKVSRLSDRDAEILRRGYYEDLMGVNRFNPDLWDIYTKRPTDWPLLQDTELARLTNDFRIIEIAPSKSIIYHNERFSTNEWGFRDKSVYEDSAA